MEEASRKDFGLNGNPLYWACEDDKVCHICGFPNHLAKDCDSNRNRNSPKKQNLDRLYNRFRPAQHRKPRFSYADAARTQPATNTTQRHTQQIPRQNTTNNQINNNEMNQLAASIRTLTEQFKVLQFQVTSLRKDINCNKQAIEQYQKQVIPEPPAVNLELA